MQNNTNSALFVGQNLVILKEVDSTNNYLKNALSKSEPLTEGTVIMAVRQYAGRGQQEQSWMSEAGRNLTFSILLSPRFVTVQQQFSLNIAVSLGINDFFRENFGEGISIKWPNDIYFGDKKLGGILIENIIQGSVIKWSIIGIGLNVNQEKFSEELKNRATSLMQIHKKEFDLISLLKQIAYCIEKRYLQLRSGAVEEQRNSYIQKLYRVNELKTFKNKDGEVFEGMIIDVTKEGYLQIDIKGEVQEFNFKEVQFII